MASRENELITLADGHWGGGLHNDVILIWERPKVVELSMEEIANKLGIPVN